MGGLRILSWNIRQGGGRRLGQIVDAIARHEPDVVAINETHARTQPHLIDALKGRGLEFSVSSNPTGRENGLARRVAIPARRRANVPPAATRSAWAVGGSRPRHMH